MRTLCLFPVLLIRERFRKKSSSLEMSQSNNCNPVLYAKTPFMYLYVCTYRIFSLVSNTYKRL